MKLDHINFVVPNIDETIKGYEKLGFNVIAEFNLHRRFVFISNGYVTYELFEDTSKEAHIHHIAYVSEDLYKDYDMLEKRGVEFITPIKCIDGLFENGMEFFLCKGPNNEVIEYCKKK